MSDADQIRDLVGRWVRATRERDVSALLAMVTDDIVFLSSQSAMVRGKGLVEQTYRSLFERADLASDVNEREMHIEVYGDVAIVWGLDGLRVTMKDSGDTTRMRGYAMSVLRREPDGWKFARGINAMSREA